MRSLGHALGEDGSALREFFACRCEQVLPDLLPWRDASFDLFLALFACTPSSYPDIAARAAKYNVDWVQIAGRDAELVHDLVDQASVNQGRQKQIGEGKPMTSWHEEAITPEQMAEVACSCFGTADRVLCVVIGSEADERSFAGHLKRLLAPA
jgi:hypothetical protein